MKVSIVINCDTRDGFDGYESRENGLFSGCKAKDFLCEGVVNKLKAFEGFDTELILYIDEHNPIPNDIFNELLGYTTTLVVRKHTNETNFNDWNYLRALQLATGDIVVHFDQDMAMFARNKEAVQHLIDMTNQYGFVSYPSIFSPYPCHDESYKGKFWASTRFFMCRREVLNFEEIKKCFDYDYYVSKYRPNRVNPWLEHWLPYACNASVFYPPPQQDLVVFCWRSYRAGRLLELNDGTFDDAINYINSRGGITYPCDVDGD